MLVVFVQRPGQDEPAATLPADLTGQPQARVAVDAEGPFSPLAEAVAEVPGLRDRLARALGPPSVARYRLARPWLLLGLLPIAALIELERQLAAAGVSGILGRLVGDVLLGAFCALELARPLPRHPRACAAALASIGTRYAYMLAASCFHTLPLLWLGAAGAAATSLATLYFMPTPRRVTAELRERLSLPPTPSPSPSPTPSPLTLALALVAATVLPAALVVARHLGAKAWGTGAILVVLGGALPFLFRGRFRLPSAKCPSTARVADAAFFGFASALALVRCVHYTIYGAAEVVRCSWPQLHERWLAPLLEQPAREARPDAPSRLVVAAMVVFVVPLVEERLYRNVFQRALRGRSSATRAIGAASAVFGLAHLGVYRGAAYQTVLMGLGFGAAYEEAGLLASLLAHVLYNASLLV